MVGCLEGVLLLMLVFCAVSIVVLCFICFCDLRAQAKALSYILLQIMTATLIYISIPGGDSS